jgi:hypothetical protein
MQVEHRWELLKNHNFFAAVKSGSEFPDIFLDTPGNPENPGKCPDIPACQGDQIRQKLNLLKCKSVKIGYALR